MLRAQIEEAGEFLEWITAEHTQDWRCSLILNCADFSNGCRAYPASWWMYMVSKAIKRKASEAEKIMYLAIFQADCALSLDNVARSRQILSTAMRTINVDNTYIPQDVFDID